jgi:hypothetical protein
MWLKLTRAEGQGPLKEVCFAHRILDFYIFLHFFLFFLMVLHDVTFDLTATI